ncbi:AI-2E family transporter YdiK [Candidatus Purcelliella pentastirinorum]|uniref:AI-2E family transporter YdiK n=1 Tax=Candidatus Purcelliella pentastirinorum TaxID=472834 RepID=UPI00237B1A0A|nr:AI-2E family transporter YdiK [Candidatus Purcelliella pentastirinorum]WDR80354.1 AI-2E family transporter YdiK [Candidatus Purcelliella pentastirinorum]
MNRIKDIFYFKKIFFSLIFIFILFVLFFLIVNPFILSFTWAGVIVISTWPILLFIERLLWNKRFLAVFIMLVFLLLLLVIPIVILLSSLIDNIYPLINKFKHNHINFPKLFCLIKIPLIGEKLFINYDKFILGKNILIFNKLHPYLGKLVEFLVFQAKQFTILLLNIILTLIFVIFLYFKGDKLSKSIRKFVCNFFLDQGLIIFDFIGESIRFIVLGVLLTALIQGVLSGIGLIISNMPYAGFLALLAILFSLLQIGSLPVLIVSIIFLYINGDIFHGSILFIWSILIAVLDGILRFVLIKMSYDIPFLLIISGIFGGFLSFGIIGVFIGPVILDILYRSINLFIYND